jgi:hypothetical protein
MGRRKRAGEPTQLRVLDAIVQRHGHSMGIDVPDPGNNPAQLAHKAGLRVACREPCERCLAPTAPSYSCERWRDSPRATAPRSWECPRTTSRRACIARGSGCTQRSTKATVSVLPQPSAQHVIPWLAVCDIWSTTGDHGRLAPTTRSHEQLQCGRASASGTESRSAWRRIRLRGAAFPLRRDTAAGAPNSTAHIL